MEKTRHIGLILGLAGAYDRGLSRGVAQFVRDEGLRWTFEFVSPNARGIDSLRSRKPDGMIASLIDQKVNSWDESGYANARNVAALGRPTVNVADALRSWKLPRVGCDDRAVGRLVADHFLERAFRHFAFVGDPGRHYSDEREVGFTERLKEAGLTCLQSPPEPGLAVGNHGRLHNSSRRFRRWLETLPRPVGLMACNDEIAWRVAQMCHSSGVSIPDHLALIGVDNDEVWCNLSYPPLSSVLTSSERIGYRAAEILACMLRGQKVSTEPSLLAPTGIATRASSDVLAIDDAEVAAAIRFIRENTSRPLGVADVVDALPLARRSLERRFVAVLGRSPAAEIRRMHVERAKTLLATSDLSMTAIAARSGFPDANRLYAVFTREVGVPPTTYRSQAALGN
jgi:LacI family transcriptional regulator